MSSTTINAIPTGAALCAELTGVDFSCVGEAQFESIHQACIDHEVLLFRDQALTDSDLIDFSRRMGALEHAQSRGAVDVLSRATRKSTWPRMSSKTMYP